MQCGAEPAIKNKVSLYHQPYSNTSCGKLFISCSIDYHNYYLYHYKQQD